jgi:hypothetical protein
LGGLGWDRYQRRFYGKCKKLTYWNYVEVGSGKSKCTS